MDRVLPWLAVGAGVLSLVLTWKGKRDGKSPSNVAGACLVVLFLLYGAAFGLRSELNGLLEMSHGIALGMAAVLLAGWVDGDRSESPVLAFGLAVLVAGVSLLLPIEMRALVWLGSAVGAGIASGVAMVSGAPAARKASFLVGVIAVASLIGSYRDGVDRAATVPVAIGVLATIALGVVRFGDYSKWLKLLVVAVVLIGGAKLLAMRYLFLGASFNVALGAIASAAVVAWILESDKRDAPGTFVVAAMIWLGWSTVAFGLLQGLGLGLTVLYGGAFLAAAGSHRGLLSLGVPVALLYYRVLLEMFPTEVRQVEMGQHYAVMGILAGAAIPIALSSWIAQAGARLTAVGRPVLAVVVGAIVVGVVVAADFVLGAKGTVGMLVGLAVTPFVAGLVPGERLGILAVSASLSALVVASFRFVSQHLLMDRDSKAQLIGWGIAIALALAVTAHYLTKERQNDEVTA